MMPTIVPMADLGLGAMWHANGALARGLDLIRVHPAFEPTCYFGSLLTDRFSARQGARKGIALAVGCIAKAKQFRARDSFVGRPPRKQTRRLTYTKLAIREGTTLMIDLGGKRAIVTGSRPASALRLRLFDANVMRARDAAGQLGTDRVHFERAGLHIRVEMIDYA